MGRKERKMQRKDKSKKAFIFTEGELTIIRKISDQLTRLECARVKKLPLVDKAYCKICGRLYCLDLLGRDSYCDKCCWNPNKKVEPSEGLTYVGCIKKTQHIHIFKRKF